MTSRLVLWIAMVIALAGAAPSTARADWDDRPDASEYEESLEPHGYWVDDSSFGRVWRPYEPWGWQPYVDGHWIWTSYGWTWSSPEPWGWTFHYGRWGFSNLYGWVWTPGYVWGPAWVDWYWGDGYVGWAPLGPVGFAVVPNYWTYVHDYSFCSPHITNVVVLHDRLPRYIVHHHEQGWGYRRSPDFRDIEHVSHHRIERVSDRPNDSVAPWVRHRIERGERVRERVADRGGERVIEHAGGRGPERGDHPHVSDDAWRRPRHDDAGGQIIERGRRYDAGSPDHAPPSAPRDVDEPRDRSGGVHITGPGRSDEGDRGGGRPHAREDGAGVWIRSRRELEAPRAHGMDHAGVPGNAMRGGGATFERGQHGGGGTGGGGAPMMHGGGGGGGHPSAGGAPHGGGSGGGNQGGSSHGRSGGHGGNWGGGAGTR